MATIVVVGAGLAGLRAAQAARASGFDGELVVLGDEIHPPYNRPPLSKELLAGRIDSSDFPGIERVAADWRLGLAATGLDPAHHIVQLQDGTTQGYDRLIIATGCRARRFAGGDDPAIGMHTLRGLDDALALRAALQDADRLAIIGAGFVGCEVAATARARGIDVTLIDIAAQPLAPLGPELGALCADLHRGHGVDLRLGTGVSELLRGEDGAVAGVRLADGSDCKADLVLVALGGVANTEWLLGSGLALEPDGGIRCDTTLTTSDDDVLAAGDVAAWTSPTESATAVRVEHWTTAAEHGRTAGANAVLAPPDRAEHVAPPYFWSDQYDVKIQSVGLPALAARVQIVEQDGTRLVAEALDAAGSLIGAVAFNHARRLTEYRRRLSETTAGR